MFGSKTDRENKKNRNVYRTNSVNIDQWMPDSEKQMSFSVLGGHAGQRSVVIGKAIEKWCGSCGVIVIHNSPELDRELAMRTSNGPVGRYMIDSGNPIYDPFAGMPAGRVTQCIYRDGMNSNLQRNAFSRYLRVLELKNIPINLSNILRLCNMSLDEIDHMLEGCDERNGIMAILQQNNIHMQICADINSYAVSLEGRIWDRNRTVNDLSLIRAVENNGIISIRVPSNNEDICNHLASELEYVVDCGMHFVLVVDSVLIGKTALKGLVKNDNPDHMIILSGDNHMAMLENNGADYELPVSLARKIILFSCTNASVARVYSGIIGKYQRQMESEATSGETRRSFFGGQPDNYTKSEMDYERVRAEEIASLGDGGILIRHSGAKRNSDVWLAKYVKL